MSQNNMVRPLMCTLALCLTAALAARAQSLTANGNSSSTYDLIRSKGYNYEVPDNTGQHTASSFQHIQQETDLTLGKSVFAFYIHIDKDDDPVNASRTDRQRNEIKTDNHSPASMVAQQGETMTLRWKFKLPSGMQTTNKFTHVHQLKGIDNAQGTADVASPLITLTCATSSDKQYMRLRYNDRDNNTTTLKETLLSNFLDEWVDVSETVTFGAAGAYTITIKRIRDNKTLLYYTNSSIDMWRTDAAGLRPKWGIYRYIADDKTGDLRDEKLLFADFSIEKTTTAITHLTTDKDIPGTCGNGSETNALVYNLQGMRVGTRPPQRGIYIVGGRKTR